MPIRNIYIYFIRSIIIYTILLLLFRINNILKVIKSAVYDILLCIYIYIFFVEKKIFIDFDDTSEKRDTFLDTRGSVQGYISLSNRRHFHLVTISSPHRSRGFYGTYVGDIGRGGKRKEEEEGRKEGRKGREKKRKGGKPASRWQGAADAPSSLIKTDRPLFFLGQAITRFIS